MREISIKNICHKLVNEYGVKLDDKIALDFFARGGDWQTKFYADKVKKVYAWEIDSKHEKSLKQNLPEDSVVTIGNSFSLAKEKNNFFDIVVLDNPQGCFGKNNVYCEHFEALKMSFNLLKKNGGILIFNVKTKPFDYTDKLEWQNRRNDFYSLSDASYLSEEFVFDFYKDLFTIHGYTSRFIFLEKRPQEPGLYALTTEIFRTPDELN
tara:strand:- start:366 stop:992 length:627 start_codon:yes stop_codon:yes gene_type:complete